jgi:hypothetical protein
VIDLADEQAVRAQLGREPRAIHAVGHRCPCGNPDVVTTEPRLPDGTPFPTTYYLTDRSALGEVEEIAGISAGGMPNRVKCLHVLAAHALAAGPGVNPLGDEVLALLGEWWGPGPCVEVNGV